MQLLLSWIYQNNLRHWTIVLLICIALDTKIKYLQNYEPLLASLGPHCALKKSKYNVLFKVIYFNVNFNIQLIVHGPYMKSKFDFNG